MVLSGEYERYLVFGLLAVFILLDLIAPVNLHVIKGLILLSVGLTLILFSTISFLLGGEKNNA